MVKYDFDTLSDRSIDNARKWDPGIVHSKFPHVRKDFIPMWIADMDFKAAPEIRKALVRMSENGAYGYTYSTDRWYNSVIHWQKTRHHVDVKKEWITLGYGTVPNMHILIQALLKDENDCVLLNTPVYGPFEYAAQHNHRKVVCVPLIKKGRRYYMDFDKIEQAMKEYHPKLTFFCSPHNPSGRIWTKDEMIELADLCLKYHVLLVSDEVHSEHIMHGTFTGALQLPEKYMHNLIMFTSPNKAFNLGGLKLSYSIIPDDHLRQIFRNRYKANSVTSPNVPGQIAMTTAYESCAEWLDQCQAYIKENLNITKQAMEELPGWEMMDMDSSYLPWVDISQTGVDMHTIAKLMADKAGVVVGVGDDYVQNYENFLRLNLGTSHAVVKEAMNRMIKAWKEYRS